MDININQFLPHIALLIFAFAFIEYFLIHKFWFKTYFRYGVVCFFYRIKINADQFEFYETSLEKTFKGYRYLIFPIPAMKFKNFSKYECAFREKYRLYSVYLSIMHGIMTYNPKTEKVTIKGKLNYFPVIILLVILPLLELSISGHQSQDFRIYLGPTLFMCFFTIQLTRYFLISYRCGTLLNNPITWHIAQQNNKPD